MSYFVYITASKRNGTPYIGVSNNIVGRMWEHKNGVVAGFSASHGVDKLVHLETFDDPIDAIEREKRLKRWKREWKLRLIEESNPYWNDLYLQII